MLPATTLTASLLALIFILLSFRVVKLRRKHGVGVGDGDISELSKAIRCHGNFTEYVPLALILLALFEQQKFSWLPASAYWPFVFGALLVIARTLHARGLSRTKGVSTGRFYGTGISWLIILILALLNIIELITGMI